MHIKEWLCEDYESFISTHFILHDVISDRRYYDIKDCWLHRQSFFSVDVSMDRGVDICVSKCIDLRTHCPKTRQLDC